MTRHATALDWVPTGSLCPSPRNARSHPKTQIRRIADSIERFGFNNPILVGDDAEIIAGHGRLAAARLLGLPKVPTLRLSHLSADERRAYRLADNKLAQGSQWDRDRLSVELQDLVDVDFSVELTGFGSIEVDGLGARRGAGSARLGGRCGATFGGPCATGESAPVWTLGRHRLACGDPADAGVLGRLLGGETVDLVMGAPPVGAPDTRQAIADALRAIAPHAAPAAVAILYAHVRQLVALVRAGASCLVDPARGRSLPRMPAVAMLVHAQADPAPELGEALAACTPEDAIVLDPFVRTDATLAAAQATGRSARLVCADIDTCRGIAERWCGHAGA